MAIEIENKESAVKEFNNILELTQTVSDNVASLEVKKFRNLISAFTCVTLISMSMIAIVYISKRYGKGEVSNSIHDLSSIFETQIGLYSTMLLILSIIGLFYFIQSFIVIGRELRKERYVLNELHQTVDNLFKYSEYMFTPYELTYIKMKMTRLRF
jgi:hypothetical protein